LRLLVRVVLLLLHGLAHWLLHHRLSLHLWLPLHLWLHHLGLTHRLLVHLLLCLLHLALHVLNHLGLHHVHLRLTLHGLLHHLRLCHRLLLVLVNLALHVLTHLGLHHMLLGCHHLRLGHHGLTLHLRVIAHRSGLLRLLHSHREHLSHLLRVSEASVLLNGLGSHLALTLSCRLTSTSGGSPVTSEMDLAG
jgi:hypothetical protein